MAGSCNRLAAVGLALVLGILAACSERPPASDYQRHTSTAISQDKRGALRDALLPQIKEHSGQSGFELIQDGNEGFIARLMMIRQAEHSIDLQYFSTQNDVTGKLLLRAILDAADRGVRVRMLLDDWNIVYFKKGATALNHHPHIELRVFNPYAVKDESIFERVGNVFTRGGKMLRRMHNKALIVDNQVAIMGGRNLGDEYFNMSGDMNFQDIDVMAAGPIVAKASQSFDSYWNSEESYPIEALHIESEDEESIRKIKAELNAHWNEVANSPTGKFLKDPPIVTKFKNRKIKLIWANAELAADDPMKIVLPADETGSKPGQKVEQIGTKARREFILITPYFVPMDNGTEWLVSLVQKGVNVRILTNSLASTDVVPAQAGYSHYRVALLEGGVEVHELKAKKGATKEDTKLFKASSQKSLHAKVYIADRKDIVIGSFNFDQRSIHLNTEAALIIHSPELASQAADIFEKAIAPERSYRVVLIPKSAYPTSDKDSKFSRLQWVTIENGKQVRYDHDPQASFGRHFMSGVFGALPIEDQL